jgi:hypothetical protein
MRTADPCINNPQPTLQLKAQIDMASDIAPKTEQYLVRCAEGLKEEGNALHKAGDYSGALGKYSRVIDNLEGEEACLVLIGEVVCTRGYC